MGVGMATGRGFPEPVGAPPRRGKIPRTVGERGWGGAGENSSPSPSPFSRIYSSFPPTVIIKILIYPSFITLNLIVLRGIWVIFKKSKPYIPLIILPVPTLLPASLSSSNHPPPSLHPTCLPLFIQPSASSIYSSGPLLRLARVILCSTAHQDLRPPVLDSWVLAQLCHCWPRLLTVARLGCRLPQTPPFSGSPPTAQLATWFVLIPFIWFVFFWVEFSSFSLIFPRERQRESGPEDEDSWMIKWSIEMMRKTRWGHSATGFDEVRVFASAVGSVFHLMVRKHFLLVNLLGFCSTL